MRTKTGGRSISNVELAANSTWLIASTSLKCPFCGFVSPDFRLTALNMPCPRCNQSGSAREMFPSAISIRRLEIVAESYVKAYAAASEKKAELAQDVRQVLGRIPEASWMDSAIRQVQILARSSTRTDAKYERFVARLEKRLALQSRDETARIIYLLATYTETSSEHYNVVTSTASLYEQLFREFLAQLLVTRGDGHAHARKSVSKLRSWKKLKEQFENTAGIPFREAVVGFGEPHLYETWRRLAKHRNDFNHVNPWAISARTAEAAFNIAKNAFALFCFLHNAYCLAPVPAITAEGQ